MNATSDETIYPNSYITLHYRVSLAGGQEIISTFDTNPATIQLGAGQLSANLENCLVGLKEGDKKQFDLSADDAYGIHTPILVQTINKAALPRDIKLIVGEPLHLVSEIGIPYAGILECIDDHSITVNFNHPLAGKKIIFDVEIIGVL